MGKTKIEWTDVVWNPVTGCSKVSEGCRNCYAESLASRFNKDFKPWTAPNAAHNVRLHPERLEQPLRWKKPRRVFVNSVSDLFHEEVPFSFIHETWDIMKATPQHSYQILTKRPKQMYEVVSTIYRLEALGAAKGFWSHVWLGISAEDQPTFEERVRYLIQTPAAVRFVSLEPLLGSVDARRVRIASPKRPEGSIRPIADWVECDPLGRTAIDELGVQYSIKQGLDWVIVGGESGPGARPLNHRWVRDIRDQCQVAGVPFWFKQWGEWAPDDRVLDIVRRDRTTAATTMDAIVGHVPGMRRVGKKRAGNELDGRVWEEMP